MRYLGPLNVRLDGDRDEAAKKIGYARKLCGALIQIMNNDARTRRGYRPISTTALRRVLNDGTQVIVRYWMGQWSAAIIAPGKALEAVFGFGLSGTYLGTDTGVWLDGIGAGNTGRINDTSYSEYTYEAGTASTDDIFTRERPDEWYTGAGTWHPRLFDARPTLSWVGGEGRPYYRLNYTYLYAQGQIVTRTPLVPSSACIAIDALGAWWIVICEGPAHRADFGATKGEVWYKPWGFYGGDVSTATDGWVQSTQTGDTVDADLERDFAGNFLYTGNGYPIYFNQSGTRAAMVAKSAEMDQVNGPSVPAAYKAGIWYLDIDIDAKTHAWSSVIDADADGIWGWSETSAVRKNATDVTGSSIGHFIGYVGPLGSDPGVYVGTVADTYALQDARAQAFSDAGCGGPVTEVQDETLYISNFLGTWDLPYRQRVLSVCGQSIVARTVDNFSFSRVLGNETSGPDPVDSLGSNWGRVDISKTGFDGTRDMIFCDWINDRLVELWVEIVDDDPAERTTQWVYPTTTWQETVDPSWITLTEPSSYSVAYTRRGDWTYSRTGNGQASIRAYWRLHTDEPGVYTRVESGLTYEDNPDYSYTRTFSGHQVQDEVNGLAAINTYTETRTAGENPSGFQKGVLYADARFLTLLFGNLGELDTLDIAYSESETDTPTGSIFIGSINANGGDEETVVGVFGVRTIGAPVTLRHRNVDLEIAASQRTLSPSVTWESITSFVDEFGSLPAQNRQYTYSTFFGFESTMETREERGHAAMDRAGNLLFSGWTRTEDTANYPARVRHLNVIVPVPYTTAFDPIALVSLEDEQLSGQADLVDIGAY